jgi:hypothetical protein
MTETEVRVSSPFLKGFSNALVDALVARGDVVLHDRDPAVQFLAEALGAARPHASMVALVEQALLECDAVDEVFIDREGLKSVIDDLGVDGPRRFSA